MTPKLYKEYISNIGNMLVYYYYISLTYSYSDIDLLWK